MAEEFDDQNYAEDLQKEDQFSVSGSKPRGVSRAPVFVYDHGFTDGVLEIDREAFEKVIEETELKKLSSVRLRNIRQQIQAKQEELRQTREELLRHKEEAIRSRQEIEFLQRQVLEKEEKKVEHQEEVNRLTEWYRSIDNFYGWVPAILFFVAGGIFIYADITITKDIVTSALDFEEKEAGILAIGLAFIAFIVKPAVDRFFEKPYLAGEHKKRNHYFLLTVAVLALLTLALLGSFRNEAVQTIKKIESLDKDLLELSDQVIADQNGEVEAEMAEKLRQRTELSDSLYSRGSIFWAFLLSSMLFALAGAICFSIGFPALTLLYRKEKASTLKWWRQKKLKELEKKISQYRKTIARKMGDAEMAEYRIGLFPALEALEKHLEELLQKEDTEIEAFFRRRIEAEKAWYLEGYERGDRYDLTGRLLITPYQFDYTHGVHNGGKAGGGSKERKTTTSTIEPPDTDGKFLHQQIRDRIRYNIDKQYHHPNGKSHA